MGRHTGLIDARTLGFDLHWRCARESAALEEKSCAAREAAHRRLLNRLN